MLTSGPTTSPRLSRSIVRALRARTDDRTVNACPIVSTGTSLGSPEASASSRARWSMA